MSATLSASFTLAAIMKGVQPLSSCDRSEWGGNLHENKTAHLGIRVKPLLADQEADNLGVVV
jgi:hypothetical protein